MTGASEPTSHRHSPPDPGTGEHPAGDTSVLNIVAWYDQRTRAQPGTVPAASERALCLWSPILGPTGSLLIHHLAIRVARDATVTVTVTELAQAMGVGPHKITVTFNRLERHGLLLRHDTTLAVRLTLPPLTPGQLRRLPPTTAAAYHEELTSPPARRDRPGHTRAPATDARATQGRGATRPGPA